MKVLAWEEKITIPTYAVGNPDKNPMFLENRVYQGSSGVVYPYAVIDKVSDVKEDRQWTAIFLENEYLKIMILPELGGRIQMAYDKTNDYHFVYYNHVIKPALVGLAGPWISGGIEFNWPQHHRPSTFEPTDYLIRSNTDGSQTVWVNEYERMFGTKCALGFTLHPGKAYLELHAKLHNRTPFPQTFLWWANPAVSVDEHYQSVFPPDVHAVFDHGKRDVSSFPIATGTYYKVDYSPGTDISVYTNIPVPTSYMAVDSNFNFLGGYDHKRNAGILHVANRHVSPGKKQWTWGCGEFGKAWDRQLTDEDGPYFELMCGVYTDNQPDFSWIMPNEYREFKQYFMPYKNVGYVKNASREVAVNLETRGREQVRVRVYVTSHRMVTILLKAGNKELLLENAELSPLQTFDREITNPYASTHQDYYLEVQDEKGASLISYTPVTRQGEAIPDPAKPIGKPADIENNEQLYLAGLHLEQYRHATYSPIDYYNEALQRDENDIRCNNAKGLWYLRRGEFETAEPCFRKAVEAQLIHNPNPVDGEPFYNLGLCLKYQGKDQEATDYLYKSTWNAAMQDNAFLQLAFISARRKDWQETLELAWKSVLRNYLSPKSRHIYALALRISGRTDEAIRIIEETLEADSFDFASRFELVKCLQVKGQISQASAQLAEIKRLMRNRSHSYIEMALQYSDAGCFNEAIGMLDLLAGVTRDPMIFYYLFYFEKARNNQEAAQNWLYKAFEQSPDRVFPNRIEDTEVLRAAISAHPDDYKAWYYLGNYYYAKRLYEKARDCWERSVAINPQFPTAARNLGLAYFNKFDKKKESPELFEKAFHADESDARILFELDQLYKKLNRPISERLDLLSRFEQLVNDRDDLYLEYVTLHSLTGNYERARQLISSRSFHPWEGGEGKVSGQHVLVHMELAKQALAANRPEAALELLQAALVYPPQIGEGKLYGARENDVYYWLGRAYEQMGSMDLASQHWEIATRGSSQPAPALYYNDQQPDKIFYQGLALKKLGRNVEAQEVFNRLVNYGSGHQDDVVKMDYFAVSLPELLIFDDDLSARNKIHCQYLMGLGYLGLGDFDKATSSLQEVLSKNQAHIGATIHLQITDFL